MSTKLMRSGPARLFNSLMLRFAGTRFFPLYGVIEHRGRRSGRIFHTVVVVRPVAEGFVVPMPWGRADRLVPQRAGRRRLCHPLEGTLPPGRPARDARPPRCNERLQQNRARYHCPLGHHPVPPPAPPNVARLSAEPAVTTLSSRYSSRTPKNASGRCGICKASIAAVDPMNGSHSPRRSCEHPASSTIFMRGLGAPSRWQNLGELRWGEVRPFISRNALKTID